MEHAAGKADSPDPSGTAAAGRLARLTRLHAALLTPYDEQGEVALDDLRRLVGHVRGQGIDGLYVGGSTGEGLLQSVAEREAILSIGQVGAVSTRDAQTLARCCARLTYDAVSAIPPIYFPHRKDAIVGYYQDILEAADGLPLIIYNIPAMSGVTFTLDDLARLLELPNVIGIKQTSVDMYQMEQLRRRFPSSLLLNGYDEMLLAGLASGADGGVGSTYNIMGARYRRLAQCVSQGDLAGAQAIQSQCNAVVDALVTAGVFPGLKYILHRQGVIASPNCRKPLATLTDVAALDRIADQLSAG
jgi:N-acetylneuraminate lyase